MWIKFFIYEISFLLMLITTATLCAEQKIIASKASELGSCVCVPFYQCEDGNIITDGAGLLDVRKKGNTPSPKKDIPVGSRHVPPKCGDYYVCCKMPSDGPTVQPYPHRCGIRLPNGINSRILSTSNKSEAQYGEWPWQAMLLVKGKTGLNYICGAVLIDEQHVLTAAHCIYQYTTSGNLATVMVRLGEWDTKKNNEMFPVQDMDVSTVHVHPQYRNSSLWNDIAVLRLSKAVNYAPNADTVCLPTHQESFLGSQCVVTGWGKNAHDGGFYSSILKVVEVPVVSSEKCQAMLRETRLGPFFVLHPSFLCAGGEEGKDSCKGDGGGPLSCYRETDGVYVLAGLVSWGIDCGERNIPGVYVSVIHFLDWITKITGNPLKAYWPENI